MPDTPVTNVNSTDNVAAAKGKVSGYVYSATITSTLTIPSDATTALSSDFVGLGYISEDGVTMSISEDTDPKRDMNGDVIATLESNHTETFSFTLEETSAAVLKEAFGQDNVTVAAGGDITVKSNSKTKAPRVFVFEFVLSNGKVKRTVVPKGKLTQLGELIHRSGDLLDYPVTITGMADANGDSHIDYIH